MKKRIYPDIEVEFCMVDDSLLHINFETFGECNNGEVIKICERYVHKEDDPIKLIWLIIECTNRFHVMCQKHIKERK